MVKLKAPARLFIEGFEAEGVVAEGRATGGVHLRQTALLRLGHAARDLDDLIEGDAVLDKKCDLDIEFIKEGIKLSVLADAMNDKLAEALDFCKFEGYESESSQVRIGDS